MVRKKTTKKTPSKTKSKAITKKKVIKTNKVKSKKQTIAPKTHTNSKTITKKQIQKPKLSPKEEAKLVEESFDLIKKLNSQVSSVEKVKTKLQEDISNLGKRMEKHERTRPNLSSSKIVSTLKEEIIKEIEPLLSNFHLKSLKVDVFKEIEQVIEVELQKLKSEMDFTNNKQQKDATKRFSEVEIRLIQTLKNQKVLEKQLKHAQENFYNLQDNLKSENKDDAINLSSIESKLISLQKDNQSLHSFLEKYENELYSRTKVEELEIEEQVKKTLKDATKKLNEVKQEQTSEEQFLVNKINEIIDYIEKFETRVKTSQTKHRKNTDKKISERFDILKKNFSEKLSYAFKDKFAKTNLFLKESIGKFNDEKENIERNLELFKVEISTLIKNYVKEIDKELTKVKAKEASYQVEKANVLKEMDIKLSDSLKELEEDKKNEREFLRGKLNEIIEVFNTLSLEQKKEINKIEKKYVNQIQGILSKETQKVQEELASQIIKNDSYLNELAINSKEKQELIKERIEEKFIIAKEQYELDFKTHLQSFDTQLKEKESEFLDKLIVVEEEKKQMLQELNSFKTDLSKLTKNYIAKYDEELRKTQIRESNFIEEKTSFTSEIDNIMKVRKIELVEHSKQLETDIFSLLEEEKSRFVMNENTFREIFKDKIENLHEYTKHKLDNLEKKFIEKNVKTIRERVNTDLKEVITLSQEVKALEGKLDKKIELVGNKEEQMFSNLSAEKDTLNKKIEERLMGLEKQLNKRFLDIDTDFSTFKGTLIDEIESLIKEVGDLVQDKVETVEKLITKLNFTEQEATQKAKELTTYETEFNREISGLREEIRDIAVKSDVQSSGNRTMNELIKQMSDYEEQLVSLVESLLAREVSHNSIMTILEQKGHPRFYVQMIIDNLHKMRGKY